MQTTTFVDSHTMSGAFVANLLNRLVDLIVAQGDDLLRDVGIEFPSRAVSSVLLIGEQGPISAADIANALDQPHQLVTQRIDLLDKLNIVERTIDPMDGRRKILKLTPKGETQFSMLKQRLAEADDVFSTLFSEIDCDLPSVAARALSALNHASLLERIISAEPSV